MNIFNLKDADEHVSDKINLDDLYDKKRESDEMKHQLYNRILNRRHERIKMTSRQKKDEQFCWYVIPEIMVGIPRYDCFECTNYILDKLHKNGFQIKYTTPNLVFISWKHHVPSYVRSEFKKKTGIVIDDRGNRVEETKQIANNSSQETDVNNLMFNNKTVSDGTKLDVNKKEYTSISSYKPSGNFVYNADMFEKLGDKLKK